MAPITGAPESEQAQASFTFVFQSAAVADGNGSVALSDGYNGTQMVELQKTGTGTTTVVVEGTYALNVASPVWYTVGYYQVDGVAALTRAAAAFALGAGTVNHVLQLLDMYPWIRVRITGTAGSVSVTANLYALAV